MTPLGRELAEIIATEGPIGVDRFMRLALGHPVHGYYMRRDPFGAEGDFTTAPEISQMFGELIGLWAAEVWMSMGRPPRLLLVELGPGRGTLMADALRATRAAPGFTRAIELHLVETSPVLRERQRATLAASGVKPRWHETVAEIPPGLAVILANEFLDALSVRQFTRMPSGWHERLVGLDADRRLTFGLSGDATPNLPAEGPPGALLEISPERQHAVGEVASRLAEEGGAGLLIDYGHDRPGLGDTLQAVRAHRFVEPLDEPGLADVTAHVDFAALASAAEAAGAAVHGPISQGDFLRALGIETRAERLKAGATEPEMRAGIDAALARLVNAGPDGMGELFRVVGLAGSGVSSLPGLPAAASRRPGARHPATISSWPELSRTPC